MEWDEMGGYDCLTPAFKILDADGSLITSIDGKDFDWDRSGLGSGVTEYRETVRRCMFDTAKLIIESVNWSCGYPGQLTKPDGFATRRGKEERS
jgi:hypothetical protein